MILIISLNLKNLFCYIGGFFENCDLTNGFFNKTFLGKIDLTTCDITGIDVDIPNIYGTTVTTMQALDLSRLLGLNIK